MSQVEWKRVGRLSWVFLNITLGLFVILMAPDWFRLLPGPVRAFWAEALGLIVVGACWLATRTPATRTADRPIADRARRLTVWIDSRGDWAVEKGLAIALGFECIWLLAGWVPHYLTWPYSRDEDTFAVLAMSWDQGILPYRDIRAYNFPGETYLFWVLGKVFGWGHTVPFYAVDAGCVLLLGAALLTWSRKRLGGIVPGLIGYIAFLRFYLNQPFEVTGERDWHTALLSVLGIMILQTYPGRWALPASALTTAMALVVRPHAVLFVPALIAAVTERDEIILLELCGRIRNILTWCLWLVLFSSIAFAPLFVAGIADDLVRGLRVASYGGPYNKATPADAAQVFLDQFTNWRLDVPLAVTLLLAIGATYQLRGMARAWCLAWLGALVYRPLHPVHHVYLIHPILVVSSVTWAFPAHLMVSATRLTRPAVVAGVMIMAYEILPAYPFMCSLTDSFYAIRPLALGEMPPRPPLGSIKPYPRSKPPYKDPPHWRHYRSLVDYLRRTTRPPTMIANVLNAYPYDTLNGPIGRMSPFLAESGICWMTWVNIDVDPEFSDQLERAEDSVVVWLPDRTAFEPGMRYARVHEVIRKYYEPAARFGQFEVWNRKPPAVRALTHTR